MTFANFALIAMAPQQGQSGQDGLVSTLMLIVPMILIFYFFIIRPQSKQAKQHKSFIDSLRPGDKIITSGGIWGKIKAVSDTTVDIEIAKQTKIRLNKGQIAGRQPGSTPDEPEE